MIAYPAVSFLPAAPSRPEPPPFKIRHSIVALNDTNKPISEIAIILLPHCKTATGDSESERAQSKQKRSLYRAVVPLRSHFFARAFLLRRRLAWSINNRIIGDLALFCGRGVCGPSSSKRHSHRPRGRYRWPSTRSRREDQTEEGCRRGTGMYRGGVVRSKGCVWGARLPCAMPGY